MSELNKLVAERDRLNADVARLQRQIDALTDDGLIAVATALHEVRCDRSHGIPGVQGRCNWDSEGYGKRKETVWSGSLHQQYLIDAQYLIKMLCVEWNEDELDEADLESISDVIRLTGRI